MGPLRRLARRLLVRSGRWDRWRHEVLPRRAAAGPTFADFVAEAAVVAPVAAPVAPVAAPVAPVAAPVAEVAPAAEIPAAAPPPADPNDWRAAFEAALARLEAEEVDDIPAPAPLPAKAPALPQAPAGEGLDRDAVERVLEELVRPALHADGGDITLVGIDGGTVMVDLVGACHSCPSSVVTLRMGVERLLADEFPAFERLIQVNAE